MRESERGFTLVEMAIAVAIAAILLVAGGVWMLSMRPGALRGAVNDFDSALAVARQLAATSGNGATLAFVPRTDGAQGFVLRVYSGRPNATNAVTVTNTMAVSSNATVSEATYGAPPFAVFLSSAGYPTGKASYPSVDGSGEITFPVVAQQPPCPANGIVLIFTSPQGATQTRSLKCNTVLTSVVAANASPTPNPPHIFPSAMVAHWTSDRNGALRFKVAEFGYTHWFAKADTGCDTITAFASPNPYGNPTNPNEAMVAPSPPSEPYSFPNTGTNPDQPPAPFELWPIAGSPGICTVGVVDDYGQKVQASVQVMGDLTSDTPSLTFSSPTATAQKITLSKTWDSESIQLQLGGGCGGVVTVTKGAVVTPSSAGTSPAKAALTIAPASAGSCTLLVGDQYGEPVVSVPINVKNPSGPLNTLGAVEFGSQTLAYEPMDVRIAQILNKMLAGGQAIADASMCTSYPYARLWLQGGAVDANSADGFNTTDANGCINNGQLPKLWATESAYSGMFDTNFLACQNYATISASNWPVGGYAAITPVAPTSGCVFPVASSDKTVINGGSKDVNLIVDAGCTNSSQATIADPVKMAVGQTCTITIPGVPNDFPICDASDPAGKVDGYTGLYRTITKGSGGSGSVSGGDGSLTVTATGAGLLWVEVQYQYKIYTNGCQPSLRYQDEGDYYFDINS